MEQYYNETASEKVTNGTHNSDLQRNAEWHAKRLGKFTGSEISALMTSGRTKGSTFGDTAKAYIFKKFYERLTGIPHQSVVETFAMRRGTELEPFAIKRLAEEIGEISEVGFLSKGCIGASPDGIQDERVIEIKCRSIDQTFNYAFSDYTQRSHGMFWQIQTEMYVSDKTECIAAHYCPDYPFRS